MNIDIQHFSFWFENEMKTFMTGLGVYVAVCEQNLCTLHLSTLLVILEACPCRQTEVLAVAAVTILSCILLITPRWVEVNWKQHSYIRIAIVDLQRIPRMF